MQNLLSSEKRTLDHWVLFLHSPGKTLLTLSLVQKWLGSPFPEDVWAVTLDALTPASVHSLWSSHKCLNQLCLTVFSSCGHPCCLCTFSYPNSSFQSTLHSISLIQHSVTATPSSNDPLWLRVNPISLSYPFPLPLPLCFARSRESKGYPNSPFDRGVG